MIENTEETEKLLVITNTSFTLSVFKICDCRHLKNHEFVRERVPDLSKLKASTDERISVT